LRVALGRAAGAVLERSTFAPTPRVIAFATWQREVAALLEVPISTVLDWGRDGTLPRVTRGRHVHFIRAHVEVAILDREQPRRV
jgi:hypothetical protein